MSKSPREIARFIQDKFQTKIISVNCPPPKNQSQQPLETKFAFVQVADQFAYNRMVCKLQHYNWNEHILKIDQAADETQTKFKPHNNMIPNSRHRQFNYDFNIPYRPSTSPRPPRQFNSSFNRPRGVRPSPYFKPGHIEVGTKQSTYDNELADVLKTNFDNSQEAILPTTKNTSQAPVIKTSKKEEDDETWGDGTINDNMIC